MNPTLFGAEFLISAERSIVGGQPITCWDDLYQDPNNIDLTPSERQMVLKKSLYAW